MASERAGERSRGLLASDAARVPGVRSVDSAVPGQRDRDRLRDAHVLLSAYACHPTQGSEPGVGWHFLRAALAVAGHVTVLTRENNAAAVEMALSKDELARCTIVAYDLGHRALALKKKLPVGTQGYYVLWQRGAREVIEEIHRRRPVAVAHHATFASDWSPAAVTTLAPEVPIVWGPVGGVSRCPTALLPHLGTKGVAFDLARSLTCGLGRALFGRTAARKAALSVALNTDDERFLRRSAQAIALEPNAFIDTTTVRARTRDADRSTVVVGVGRLTGWKGWGLAIRALRSLPDAYVLELYGEGDDRPRLEALAKRLEVEERVVFHGHQPRDVVMAALSSARCLVFPSLHDSAPGAVAEAISSGCPVVCLDVGGAGDIARMSGGSAVPARRGCAVDLAEAIRSAHAAPNRERWDARRAPELVAGWYSDALVARDLAGIASGR